MSSWAAALGLSLVLMLAVGMWCGGDRARRASRIGVAAVVALGWLALIGGSMSSGFALRVWTGTAIVASIVAAHLIAYVIGDAVAVKREGKTPTPRARRRSFNFTRDAFYRQEWNELTTTARGLFLNTDTGAVAGRGHAKFFNIGERPETALTAVLARFGDGGPVKVEHKLNGFLGLAFAHNGQLRTFSKSGPSAFADEFGRLLAEHLGDRLTEFAAALEKSGVTLTFEVLSPADPHIVDDGAGVVLLHAVARTTERTLLLDEVGDRIGEQFGFRRPATATVSGPEALRDAIDAAARSDTEGAVLRHLPTGQMVKVKSDSYAAWKALRATLTRLATGKLDLDDLRSSRVPRFAAAVAVTDWLHRQGLSLSELMLDAVHSPALDLPRVRALVGDLPEVLNLSTTAEREAA